MSPALDAAWLVGRVVFGVVLGFMGLANLLDLEASVGYARHKGVPVAGLAVPAGSLLLLGGGVSLALGVLPRAGAAAVALFLIGVTPLMHDFWNHSGEDRQNEQIQFLKNAALLGAALALVALADWPFALA